MAYIHRDCPFCPYTAPVNSLNQVRTDILRRHVQNVHGTSASIIPDYEGANGFKLEKINATLYLQTKMGKFGDAFCNSCQTWIRLEGFVQTNRRDTALAHSCKQKQVRDRLKVVNGKIEGGEKSMSTAGMLKIAKECGADDYIELTDDHEFDLKKTLKYMMAQMKTTKTESVLERLQQEPSLSGLKLTDREYQRRDGIDALNADAEEDPTIELEVFNEYDDIILPCFNELAKAAPQREQLKETIKALRHEIGTKDDLIEQLKSSANCNVEDMQERLNSLSKELTEERSLRHRAEKELLTLQGPAAPAPAPDTISHQGGNEFEQWTLQYQG